MAEEENWRKNKYTIGVGDILENKSEGNRVIVREINPDPDVRPGDDEFVSDLERDYFLDEINSEGETLSPEDEAYGDHGSWSWHELFYEFDLNESQSQEVDPGSDEEDDHESDASTESDDYRLEMQTKIRKKTVLNVLLRGGLNLGKKTSDTGFFKKVVVSFDCVDYYPHTKQLNLCKLLKQPILTDVLSEVMAGNTKADRTLGIGTQTSRTNGKNVQDLIRARNIKPRTLVKACQPNKSV